MNDMFDRFKDEVLRDNAKLPTKQNQTAGSLLTRENMKVNRVIAIIVGTLNLIFLVSILLRGDFVHIPLTDISVILLVLSSAWVVFICFRHDSDYTRPLYRFSLLFYDLCIVVSTVLLTFSINRDSLLSGGVPDMFSVSVTLCYYLLFVVAPLDRISDSVILAVAVFAGDIILLTSPYHVQYSPVFSNIVILFVVIGYVYFWIRNHAISRREIEIRMLNLKLLYSSYIDHLTGALNRTALDSYLVYLRDKTDCKSAGIMMFDIDAFKMYNDYYSHVSGDKMLKDIAAVLSNNCPNEAPYLFRFGGEEFVVIYPNSTEQELMECAKIFRLAIWKARFKRKDPGTPYPYVTTSVGAALVTIDTGTEAMNFIKEADEQLYVAKENGKNCVAYGGNTYR